ncbi:isopenicillin N synthase family dioxygenase [Modestobacter versicolor]|uniref:Isopenicillin N synthase family oxygenase n=1 Tax=Modestobacter versicolor TaxID=429133 RepID=A0A323VAH6_9ACTN|nr:2-oxoglutarate and iron-dependent oxygenase domain-containing protein [Modestobacter versicolor]MBB3675994.1 isopenicillin N synthase-like dioxygenase [Modestobacter versicolor]PZA21767.1 isopenicillin N synthase family oxygenase [Modestobacter versicolor]
MTTSYSLTELDREARMGAAGSESSAREIRQISLADFATRREQIADELWAAATDIGFFQLVDHGIDVAQVDRAFALAREFFALPEEVKARYPLKKGLNSGWESKSQVRPSTGTPDQKESWQLTRPHMAGLWPSEEEVAGFRQTILDFEARCWRLAMDVLSCFASRLGFDRDFFARAHDPSSPSYQSTLRLIHYFPFPPELVGAPGIWRAGAHTDFDCLTLLFQRAGQGGLQVLPGAEAHGQEWTPVEPSDEAITCNIGDMLMRWSDDLLPSNFHRVKVPGDGDHLGARYSIAFFAQADKDALIESPRGTYEPISAGEYLLQRIQANFAR